MLWPFDVLAEAEHDRPLAGGLVPDLVPERDNQGQHTSNETTRGAISEGACLRRRGR